MHAVASALLAQMAMSAAPILELGCGAGAFMAELTARYPAQAVYGADINSLALTHASRLLAQPPKLAGADLQALPFVDATFGLVLALDAIDQKGVDPVAALAESWRVLQPQGLLLLRVSAHAWLKGLHDVAFNTGHRFARRELVNTLDTVGFTPIRTTYANALLAPAIVPVRLLQRWGLLPFNEAHYTAPMANRLLALILQAEAQWLQSHNFGFGVSLYVLARKNNHPSILAQEPHHANQSTCLHRFANVQ